MSTTSAPAWAVHLPADMTPSDVDLSEGGSLPGSWVARWRADPDRTVLATLDGARVSAAALHERTAAAAGRYAAAGLHPGDRVLIAAGTSIDTVVAYVGALRAGLTVVPANPTLPPREVTALAEAARPALGVLEVAPAAGTLIHPMLVTPPDLSSLPAPGEVTLDRVGPADTALIIYTSGTTGRPKGVPLSHANLLASAHAVRLAWRWTPEDNLALGLPLFHVHGLGVGLNATLSTGATATLMPKFDPAAVAAAVHAGASLFFGVPTMYHRIAESEYLAELAALRLAVSGSAPLAADLFEAVRVGCGQRVLERYGMTETVMLVSNPYEGERRPGTVGFPLPGVDLRLAPRPGGTAEIQVRGPNVIGGYLDDPAATADAYTGDRWFRTGDLGEYDEAGYLRISGRAKELIITGGYNVYPREVEEVLRAHPGVLDAAVAGVPSRQWGETLIAFVVASHEGLRLSELEEWSAQRLVSYKRPRQWRVVDSIPRNALGKILRHELNP